MRWAWLLGVPLVYAQTLPMVAYVQGTWPRQDVCVVRLDGTERGCLTRDGRSHHPAWAPDGSRLLFVRDAERGSELWVMDGSGANQRRVPVMAPVVYEAAWSPDGKTLAVSAKAGEPGVYLVRADGAGGLRLWRRNAYGPAWAPDGIRLAFAVEQPRGRWAIHVANVDGSGDVRLTEAGAGGWAPAWSPDGKKIAFGRIVAGADREQVFVMNADGTGVRQLTVDSNWSCGAPSWSASGGSIVTSCRSAGRPCGMGVFSTGQRMPQCDRRLLVLAISGGIVVRERVLIADEGAMGVIGPR